MKTILEKALSDSERKRCIVKSSELKKLTPGSHGFRISGKLETLNVDKYGRLYMNHKSFHRLGLIRPGSVVIIDVEGQEYRIRAGTG